MRIAAQRHHHQHQHDQHQHQHHHGSAHDTQPQPTSDPSGQKDSSNPDRQHGNSNRDLLLPPPTETDPHADQHTEPERQQSSSSTLLRRSFTAEDDGDGHGDVGREVSHYDESQAESEDQGREVLRDDDADRQQEHSYETQHETGDFDRFGTRSQAKQELGGDLGFRIEGDGTEERGNAKGDWVGHGSQVSPQWPPVNDSDDNDRSVVVKEEQKQDDERRNQHPNPVLSAIPSKSTSTPTTITALATTVPAASLPPPRQPSNPISQCNCVSTALQASALALPHPSHTFDFAICIAVIHHLATRERRVEGIREILRTLRRSPALGTGSGDGGEGGAGQALIFVWALEQSSSRRGWSVGDEQDQLVPWVLKPEPTTTKGGGEEKQKRKGRRPSPLPQSVRDDGNGGSRRQKNVGQTPEEGGEEGSGQAQAQAEASIHVNDRNPQHEAEAVPTQQPEKPRRDVHVGKTFHRFYHLYHTQELESECVEAGGVVVEGGYERDNWWVVVEPTST